MSLDNRIKRRLRKRIKKLWKQFNKMPHYFDDRGEDRLYKRISRLENWLTYLKSKTNE